MNHSRPPATYACSRRPTGHCENLCCRSSFGRIYTFDFVLSHWSFRRCANRGDDWRLLAEHFLDILAIQYGDRKQFSTAALELLSNYTWPGNIRELRAIVTMGYSLTDGNTIEPSHFACELGRFGEPGDDSSIDLYVEIVDGRKSYWDVVYPRFMDRELSRSHVRAILNKGLARRW